ncbi:MAG TPA: hypothetical protein VHU87_00675 [Rhizomicrobium sp.]|jgi:hypothetical protein|nr:hypothetical protein [Rhizomicrobium sp.]
MRNGAKPELGFIVAAGVILAGLVLCLVADLPGHLSYDSVVQLMEGRAGRYANWHPAVMSWLLGLADAAVRGTALYVILTALVFFASLFGLLLTAPRPHWAAAMVAGALALTPQLLIYQGTVWKDVLFANAAVAGFVCLALAATYWAFVRWRFGLIAGAVLLFALAALARQNGAVVALVGAVTVGWIASREVETRRLHQGAIYGAAALLAVALAALGGRAALATRDAGTSGPVVQLQLLQTYDVIGAVANDPSLKLDAIGDDDEHLERIIRTVGVRVWTPERNDTLGNTPALENALDDADPGTMGAQWRDLLLHHPLLYLRVRAELFRWVFLTPDLKQCLPYEIGVDGPPAVLADLGLAERLDARDRALDRYGAAFVGTPVLSHLFYAVLALIALFVLVRRRRPADVAVAGMLTGAFAVTASFFVISIACDYRYLYLLDVATMQTLFYLALDPASAWKALRI